MNAYIIYLENNVVAIVTGTECAYAVYRKTAEIAEMLGQSARLVWNASGEVVASTDDEDDEDEGHLSEEDLDEAVLEMGFDPYEGGYTWDC